MKQTGVQWMYETLVTTADHIMIFRVRDDVNSSSAVNAPDALGLRSESKGRTSETALRHSDLTPPQDLHQSTKTAHSYYREHRKATIRFESRKVS